MRNLWRFINRYNAFFLFIIYFTISIIFLVKNNDFQRASTLNSSNKFIGSIYEKREAVAKYLFLNLVNDSLAAENSRLRKQLNISPLKDSAATKRITDTINNTQYDYIVGEVINKSVTSRNNYITINRGARNGIKKGMGVIGSSGVVGIVWNVSENYTTIQSILHEDTRISSSIQGTPYFGSLIWEGQNPMLVTLTDIPNQFKLKKGANVVTSGLGVVFPKGIMVGKVIKSGVKSGGSFLDISVKLSTNFYALQYVYVVKNNYSAEQQNLEAANKGSINE